MRACGIVMRNPFPEELAQVQLIYRDRVVPTFATYDSDQSFTMSVDGRHVNG